MAHPIREVFEDLASLVDSKAHDYADGENVFSNFEGAAHLAGVTVQQVFHVLLGVKMERLRQLASGKNPKFESMEDTLMDLANYTALWIAYERKPLFGYIPAAEFYDLTEGVADAILELPED